MIVFWYAPNLSLLHIQHHTYTSHTLEQNILIHSTHTEYTYTRIRILLPNLILYYQVSSLLNTTAMCARVQRILSSHSWRHQPQQTTTRRNLQTTAFGTTSQHETHLRTSLPL